MEPANVALALEVDEKVIHDFRNKHGEKVLLPGDSRYDAGRKVWNGMMERSRTVLVQCRDRNDVIAAVNVARTINLPVAVKAGGHNVSGNAVCDGGVMIDLSQ